MRSIFPTFEPEEKTDDLYAFENSREITHLCDVREARGMIDVVKLLDFVAICNIFSSIFYQNIYMIGFFFNF